MSTIWRTTLAAAALLGLTTLTATAQDAPPASQDGKMNLRGDLGDDSSGARQLASNPGSTRGGGVQLRGQSQDRSQVSRPAKPAPAPKLSEEERLKKEEERRNAALAKKEQSLADLEAKIAKMKSEGLEPKKVEPQEKQAERLRGAIEKERAALEDWKKKSREMLDNKAQRGKKDDKRDSQASERERREKQKLQAKKQEQARKQQQAKKAQQGRSHAQRSNGK